MRNFAFHRTLCLCALLIVCFIGAPSAFAQSQATTGQIVGTVKDPQQSAVSGATAIVTNTGTGLTQTLTTNEDGGFRAVNLPPGNYTLTVTAQGFGELTQTGYQVTVGSSLDANVTLQVTAVTEEVTVTSAAVETTQAQSTVTLNSTAIEGLPIQGRRFQDFVTLTPGADVDPTRGQISLVGQRGINSNIQIDGADYNNPFFGGIRGGERSNEAFTFPQSAIREFQVVASGYNAEFGRSTGGIVNAVTKSGTNDFSGEAFYLNRPERISRRNAFNQRAAPTLKQFGGAIGGPLVSIFGEGNDVRLTRDKAFFFFSYEQQQLQQPRLVDLPNLDRISPTTTAGIAEAFNFYSGLETPFTQTNDARALVGRVDVNFSEANQFNVRYNYSNNEALNATASGNSLSPSTNNALSNNGTESDNQHTVVGQLTSFISPTIVNELRVQYSRETRPRLSNEFSPLVDSIFGTFGTRSFLPTTEQDYRVQLLDNVIVNAGTHSFKFGVDYNYAFADQAFGFRQTGNFDFLGLSSSDFATPLRILTVGNAGGTSDPANRFDDTRVRYRRQVGNTLADLAATDLAFYGQDSWRIRPNFTLNYGLRYEANFLPTPDANNTELTNLVANTDFALGRVDPRVIPDLTNQFAPRFGFAYDPFNDGKTVIRGFAGLYYARTPLLTLAGPINNFRTPPGDVVGELRGFTTPCANGIAASDPRCPNTTYKQFLTIGIDLNQFPLGNLPILTVEQFAQIQRNVSIARGITPNPLTGQNLVTAGEGLKNPRSAQFGFGFEREVSRGITLGTTFDYVNTVNLNRNRDINLPMPIIRTGDASQRPFFGLAGRPRPASILGFIQVREPSARSLYRAVTVRAQMRRGFGQFDAFYTFSSNFDDDTTERNATFSEYDNSFDLSPEYNRSRLDRPHAFVFNALYNAPFGFQVSTTGRFRSGTPIDATVSGIVAPAGSGLTNAQYANLVTLTTTGSTSGDLNQDFGNFSDRPYIAPGVSSLRNSYRNEPVYNVDLRLQRDFVFGEKYRLSPSIEAFNLFNFENVQLSGTTVTNYGNPGVNERTGEVLAPSNPNFLRLRDDNGNFLLNNTPGDPLRVQLGIRFTF